MRPNNIARIKDNISNEGSRAKRINIDIAIISDERNLRWLTGRIGLNIILVIPTDGRPVCLCPTMELGRVAGLGFEVLELKEGQKAWKVIKDYFEPKTIGTDAGFAEKQEGVKRYFKKIVDISNIITNLRQVKTASEIKLLSKARKITLKGIKAGGEALQRGISELELAGIVEHEMRKQGAQSFSFDTIIAFGKNSAVAHHIPTNKRIKSGDVVLIDAGAVYGGYCADITKMFYFHVDEKIIKLDKKVCNIRDTIIDSIKARMYARDVEKNYKNIMQRYCFERVHKIGHGIGVEVHEKPQFSLTSLDRLVEGSVFTIEPAVYINGLCGIRKEDMYFIDRKGELRIC